MQTTQSRSLPISRSTATSYPWLMLISRSALFLFFQILITLVARAKTRTSLADAWTESARWWTFLAFLANFVSIYLLVRLYKAEGKDYFKFLSFSRATWKADLLWFLGFSIFAMPFAAFVRDPLGAALFGDAMTPTHTLFRPLPTWAFLLSFLFPLTIAFAELPTYFGYCMPRLFREGEVQTHPYLAWFIASFFLAAQHMFLPLIFNGRFIFWRLGMFLPFAFITGLFLKIRPSLLPYFIIVHALMDVTTVLVYLMI